MKELEDLSPDQAEWQQHFEILMHGVLHHATEEEAEMARTRLVGKKIRRGYRLVEP